MTGKKQLRTNKKYFFLILVESNSGLTKKIIFLILVVSDSELTFLTIE